MISLISILSACSSKNDTTTIFENYLYRLANSLEVQQAAVNEQVFLRNLPRFPKRRDLTHSVVNEQINLLEFLRLSSCDLQRHIGQRNSVLGRVMKSSQQLIYEYQFIELAEDCLQQLSESSQLSVVLDDTLRKKQKNLIKVQWNAAFSSEEMQTTFSQSELLLSRKELSKNPNELISAFERLSDFTQDTTISSQKIEEAYAVLASSHYLGQLRLTIAMATTYLTAGDSLLESRLGERPLCIQQRANPKFEILDRVFMKFYIGETQPMIAQLHQRAKILFAAVDELQALLKPTVTFQRYWEKVYTGETSEWNRFNLAIAKHTKNWQSLLSQCGRLPQ
ncbi:MAG: hypothetical protein ACI82Z_000911 [Cellvibrionaceae bacterium]|jgi:hypothetical protein